VIGHEYKGKQELFIEAQPDILKVMLEIARKQSTGASNRIEGIYTSDARLEELVREKAEPRNRPEQEIAGYREVLNTIHKSYEYIIPRPNIIIKVGAGRSTAYIRNHVKAGFTVYTLK